MRDRLSSAEARLDAHQHRLATVEKSVKKQARKYKAALHAKEDRIIEDATQAIADAMKAKAALDAPDSDEDLGGDEDVNSDEDSDNDGDLDSVKRLEFGMA